MQNAVVIQLGVVRIERGKQEWYNKPAASALGVTEASHNSPIKKLIIRLLDEGMLGTDDHVVVKRGENTIFQSQPASHWLDGQALGRVPGSCPWLRRK